MPTLRTCSQMGNGGASRLRQSGVVLFIALIALVTLALAAVALVRSVDTNTIIAGNLAMKQSATLSADNGVESAIRWLSATFGADREALDTNSTVNGYYATSTGFDPVADSTWSSVDVAHASGSLVNSEGVDGAGNRIRYVIQRMCSQTGEPAVETCVTVEGESGTSSKRVDDTPGPEDRALSPLYRITARVDGPKNTVSYVQAFVY